MTARSPCLYCGGELESTGAEEEIELPFPKPEWVAAMDAERGAKSL